MCGNKRLSNDTINASLRDLRVQIREGKVNVQHAFPDNFQRVVLTALGAADTPENFNPQTLRRLNVLFDVPPLDKGYPSQDQTAWAIQNFINRRSNPWSHVTRSQVEDTDDMSSMHV